MSTLHIKNMVCKRCIMAVDNLLKSESYHVTDILLGEVEILESPNSEQLAELDKQLHHLGFELIDDRTGRLVEKIKNMIVQLVHYSAKPLQVNLSEYLTRDLPYEYNYLSNLFSEVSGTTIEKFYISQKIEKIKELLIYDELSLNEIAYQMGYSSSAYLSSQFKKATGLTPGYFKAIRSNKRRNIEEL
ncbi:helix-turn-helix domain-containing protein [Mucilaginibacter agri]|uniref:Helix-turn-helix domain-containing protein n=1 Tax=Mucilaginibacter agri TaxID=2695265 RepID=A0A966DU01_9SPHI|nr:AraC family transcriptional regulator [Mucilaginibacter agri]NCD69877.1 helix-turn-helix domain-containing protein [Mucilaginibacter agri]